MSARLSAGETADPPPADLCIHAPLPTLELVDEAREEVKKFLLGTLLFLKKWMFKSRLKVEFTKTNIGCVL